MCDQSTSVLIGGGIGILSGLLISWFNSWLSSRKIKNTVLNAMVAQIQFAKDKVQRYKSDNLRRSELKAGMPLFKSLAENVGYLSPKQASATTKALLMYFEFAESGHVERGDDVITACDQALTYLK